MEIGHFAANKSFLHQLVKTNRSINNIQYVAWLIVLVYMMEFTLSSEKYIGIASVSFGKTIEKEI